MAFQPKSSELLSFMRLLPEPGPLLVAADLHLLPEGRTDESWRALFEPSRLAASRVIGRRRDCRQQLPPLVNSGFVRLLVLNRHLTAGEAGSLGSWLLDVETYRTLALLGLPEAEAVGPTIRRIETELSSLPSADTSRGRIQRQAVNYFTV